MKLELFAALAFGFAFAGAGFTFASLLYGFYSEDIRYAMPLLIVLILAFVFLFTNKK